MPRFRIYLRWIALAGLPVIFSLLTASPSEANVSGAPTNCSVSTNSRPGTLATSSDGRYVLYASSNLVFRSSNYCESSSQVATMTLVDGEYVGIPTISVNGPAGVTAVYSTSVSNSGQFQSVGTDKGVYFSNDFGVTWKNRFGTMGDKTWYSSVAAYGEYYFAASSSRVFRIRIATNTSELQQRPTEAIKGIRTNRDGSIYFIETDTGLIKRSVSSSSPAFSIVFSGKIDNWSMSSDGKFFSVIAAASNKEIKISNDFGSTFSSQIYRPDTFFFGEELDCVTISEDGKYLVVGSTKTLFTLIRESISDDFVFSSSEGGEVYIGYSCLISSSQANVVYACDSSNVLQEIAFTPWQITGLDNESRDGGAYLYWTPEYRPVFPLIDYYVEYSTNLVDWTRFNDGVSTNAYVTVTGLTNGTRYYFRITPVNRYGFNRLWEVDDWGAIPFGNPIAPVSILKEIHNGNLVLDVTYQHNGLLCQNALFRFYEAVTNNFISGVSHYSCPSTFTWYSSDLINGKSYYVKTSAKYYKPINWEPEQLVKTRVESPQSTSNSVKAISNPGEPKNIGIELGDASATVKWSQPSNIGESNITGYDIYVKYDPSRDFNDSDIKTVVGGGATFSAPINGITNNIYFDLGLRAKNAAGNGPIVNVGQFVTKTTPTVSSSPRITNIMRKSSAITMNWERPAQDGGASIIGYRLTYQKQDGSNSPVVLDFSANVFSTTINSLDNYVDYQFSLTARNNVGFSAAGSIIAKTFGVPQSLSLTRAASGARAGAALSTQPKITLLDDSNSTMILDSSTVIVATISSGAFLIGSETATVTSGVATFANLGVVGTASTTYTLTFSVVIDNNKYLYPSSDPIFVTQAVAVTSGPAYKLALKREAGGTQPGVFTTQPIIQILDRGGNPITGGTNRRITVTAYNSDFNEVPFLSSSAEPSLYVDTSTSEGAFTTLAFYYPAVFDLIFTSPDLISTTQTITPTPGTATNVAIATNTSNERLRVGNVVLGAAFSQQPIYKIVDVVGTLVSDFVGTVSLSVSSGRLVGKTVATIKDGVATFSNLKIVDVSIASSSIQPVTLTASVSGLTSNTDMILVSNGSYFVKFDRNGARRGIPPVSNLVRSDADSFVFPNQNTMLYPGKTFIGWSDTNTATTALSSSYLPRSDVILYAVWQSLPARTFTFTQIPTPTYGDTDFTISYSISSRPDVGTVTFQSLTSSCSILDGKIRFIASGDCKISGSLTGEEMYQTASAFMEFRVLKKQVNFTATPKSKDYDGNPKILELTSSSVSGVVNSDNVQPRTSHGDASSSNAGTYPIQFSYYLYKVGDNPLTDIENVDWNYFIDTSTASFTINPANQTISFSAPANMTLGGAPQTLNATSSSGLVVSFSTNDSSVCSIDGVSLTAIGAGSCSVTASQAGSGNFKAASTVTQRVVISSPPSSAPTPPPAPSAGSGGGGGGGGGGAAKQTALYFKVVDPTDESKVWSKKGCVSIYSRDLFPQFMGSGCADDSGNINVLTGDAKVSVRVFELGSGDKYRIYLGEVVNDAFTLDAKFFSGTTRYAVTIPVDTALVSPIPTPSPTSSPSPSPSPSPTPSPTPSPSPSPTPTPTPAPSGSSSIPEQKVSLTKVTALTISVNPSNGKLLSSSIKAVDKLLKNFEPSSKKKLYLVLEITSAKSSNAQKERIMAISIKTQLTRIINSKNIAKFDTSIKTSKSLKKSIIKLTAFKETKR